MFSQNKDKGTPLIVGLLSRPTWSGECEVQFQPGRLLGSVHCEPLCSDDKFVPPKRFLVHDELASFPDTRGDQVEVRIRVWMGKNATPIALVSQIGQVHPRQIAVMVANHIQESLLKFRDIGYLYFEWGKAPATMTGICSKPEFELCQTVFQYYGHDQRLRMYKPCGQPKSLEHLRHILGEKIQP
jgi:hypothetical protein